jgi:hypothetical protein
MDFIVSVGQNRGWDVRRFFDIDEALQWLASPENARGDAAGHGLQ